LLANRRITIDTGKNDSDENGQELFMQLSPAFLKFQDEALQAGEAKAKAEVAINMLKAGMSEEQVVQLTGLSMELILKLAEEIGEANR
jgi:hypothetical protein